MIPAFDYAADKNGDGYLNDAEYATRAAGMDARFVYESRLFYPYYGQMRFVTNPSRPTCGSGPPTTTCGCSSANPLADGIFMDNSTGKLPFPGIAGARADRDTSATIPALVAAVSRAIAPKWVLANTAGGGRDARRRSRPGPAGGFEEFLLRPLHANWSEVGRRGRTWSHARLRAGGCAVPGDRHASAAAVRRPTPRTQLATLPTTTSSPTRTARSSCSSAATNPSSSWTEHWSPAGRRGRRPADGRHARVRDRRRTR